MGEKQRKKDTRAPEEVVREKMSRSGVVEQPTPRAQPVGDVLETLQAQAKDAMPSAVFDDDVTIDRTPLLKRMRSEIGSAEVSAKRREPNVQANVAIEVRCDRDEQGDGGRYQVCAGAHVGRESKGVLVGADIPVLIEVNDANGSLKLDSDQMRDEITDAVRSTDDALKRKQ